MSDVGVVDTSVARYGKVLVSCCWVKNPVTMKIHDGINDDEEAEGDGGQGGEEHQETEHVGPRNPVQTTVRASHTVNSELVH